ncbi:uncharacterized protein LOC123197037 [Mangifera indica]|uniref:uncharacterized protein LOC123197037 n=1 Tax=Mangifera indica TaxID=29780 RepID=UPI001CFBA261|nr:uncharacterized protein LOC123197037 [Mangifera indica]
MFRYSILFLAAVLFLANAHALTPVAATHADLNNFKARMLRLVPTGPNPGSPHAALNQDPTRGLPLAAADLNKFKGGMLRLVPSGPNPGSPHAALNQEPTQGLPLAAADLNKFKGGMLRLVPSGPNPGSPHAAQSKDDAHQQITEP